MTDAKYHVLILGAGLVSRPVVELLLSDPDYTVTLADMEVTNAEKILKGHPRGKATRLDVVDEQALQDLVNDAHIVVSLLPFTLHPLVAAACIRAKISMVNASYVSPAMRDLDDAARAAGILILCEIGLDPGIDHMSAMRIIHRIQNQGGKVVGFNSYCGGLPAPEANDNPLGYKFSWSPKGVLLAGLNDAHYLRDKQQIDVAGDSLFKNFWPVSLPDGTVFEAYPNRDSLAYIKTYGLDGIRTMLRGTLRNKNWCNEMEIIKQLGFLGQADRQLGRIFSLRQLTAVLAGLGESDLEHAIQTRFGLTEDAPEMQALRWLGLFDAEPRTWADSIPINCLTTIMSGKMSYAPGERDMVVLHHEFEAELPTGNRKYLSTLVDYGIPGGSSAMARTVTLPVGIAVKLIVSGKVKLTGVKIPVEPKIYEPVLDELEKFGVSFQEQEIQLH